MKIVPASLWRCLHKRIPSISIILALALLFAPVPQPTALGQDGTTQQSTVQVPPLPMSPVEVAEKDGTAIRMSLRDITKLALQNNLDIAISDTNEDLYQQKLIQTYGPYDPAFTARLGVQSSKSPNTNLSTAATGQLGYNQVDFALWNLGFSQNIATGGQISAYMNSNRQDTNQAFALFTPQYSASGYVQFTQPLRRNFKIDQNRGNIKLANLDLKTNDSQFKQKVTDTISKIMGSYWDLVGAIRDYDIKRESVKLAQITLRDNRKKVEIGTLAPIGITEAQAEAANREVDLISAEERIFNVENTLRSQISSDRNADIWNQFIVPTDTPEYSEYKVQLRQAIDTALQNRPELEQLRINLQRTDIGDQLYQSMKKWQFDLVAGFGAVGVAGPQTIGENGLPRINPDLVGGALHAYQVLFTQGFTNWSVGFNLQIPLRNRNMESQIAQNKITQRQLLMNQKNTELAIQVDVRNSAQAIETARKQVDTAKVARELAKEQLDGEEKRYQAGLSQNFLVLDRQRALAQAQGNELQALIAFKKAIINLQRSMYTLLESNDFEIAKSSSTNVGKLQ